MKGLIQIIIGLIVWVVTLYLLSFSSWWQAVLKLVQGSVVLVIFFIGLGLILLGISELRS